MWVVKEKRHVRIHDIRPEQLSDGVGRADRGTLGGTVGGEIVEMNGKHSHFRRILNKIRNF